MKTRSRGSRAGCGPGSDAPVIWLPYGRGLAPLEGAGFALFGEGAGGFVEVFAEIELQRGGLHDDLALELLHVPAAGAHRRPHRERGVFRDLGGELVGDFEMLALRRDPVDDAGRVGLLGGEE